MIVEILGGIFLPFADTTHKIFHWKAVLLLFHFIYLPRPFSHFIPAGYAFLNLPVTPHGKHYDHLFILCPFFLLSPVCPSGALFNV